MNLQFFEKVISDLCSIRDDLRNSAESSVIQELDRVIEYLEAAKEHDPPKVTKGAILELLGNVLNKAPSIIQLIEKLSE